MQDKALVVPQGPVDWEALRTEYVTGNGSLDEMAKKYGLAARTLEKHSSPGRWALLRAQFRHRVNNEAQAQVSEKVDDLHAKWKERYRDLELVADHIKSWFDLKLQTGLGLTPKDINDLMKALDLVIKNQRVLIGESGESSHALERMADKVFQIMEKYVPLENRQRLKNEILGLAAEQPPALDVETVGQVEPEDGGS